MARKGHKRPGVRAEATVKLEAVAKASYERKKTTTEIIPPDVTRAKVGAWIDLISPITEWAGLKGDALRYKRAQLRIQQEEALSSLAMSVRTKMIGKEVAHPVPPKLLVPILEKVSLEDPSDQHMIDAWANLLVSSALGRGVHPRFVGILGELSSSQAKALEAMFFKDPKPNSDFSHFDGVRREIDEPELVAFCERAIDSPTPFDNLAGGLDLIFDNRGLALRDWTIVVSSHIGEPVVAKSFVSHPEGLDKDILCSLNLIVPKRFHFKAPEFGLYLRFFQISDLGLKFLSVCSPAANDILEELEKKLRKGKK